MPLHVTLTPAPLVRHASTTPLWKRLHRVVDTLLASFQTLWQTLFADVRASLDTEAVQDVLAMGNTLLIENVLAQVWHTVGTTPAEQLLPPVLTQTVEQAAQTVAPSLAQTFGVLTPRLDLSNPAATAWIDQYAGTQIRGIGDETLAAVRQILRTGQTEGRTVAQMARDLRAVVGLNTRQAGAVEALRQRLTAQGLPEAQVTRKVQQAADTALRQRVKLIAMTETQTAANQGQHALTQQAVAQGAVRESQVRRYWLVTPDDKLCPICAAIPGQNPEGVGLNEPFQTPVGDLLTPGAHPACRCVVNTELVP